MDQQAFFVAIKNADYGLVKELLDSGVNVDVRNDDDQTALIYLAALEEDEMVKEKAPRSGQWLYKDVVKLMLQHSIDVEAKDKRSYTALHWAVERQKTDMIEFLLSTKYGNSANVDSTAQKMTPLHIAAENGVSQIVDFLLDNGADCNTCSTYGWAPLHFAAKKGHTEVVQSLLQSGADATIATDDSRIPLHWAAENGHIVCVRLLAKKSGSKRQAKDSAGYSPSMLAGKNGHSAIMQLLSPHNSDENLSPLAEEVCKDYRAVVIDINPQKKGTMKYENTARPTVYDLLYAKETDTQKTEQTKEVDALKPVKPNDTDVRMPVKTIGAKQNLKTKGGFRWIHLPANNLVWVEVGALSMSKEES